MSMTNAVRKYRTAAKMSQTELAKILGISSPLLSYIEGGAVVPEMKIIRVMCELFSCSPNSLFDLSQFQYHGDGFSHDLVIPVGAGDVEEFKEALDLLGYSCLEEWYREQARHIRIRAAIMRCDRNIIQGKDGD